MSADRDGVPDSVLRALRGTAGVDAEVEQRVMAAVRTMPRYGVGRGRRWLVAGMAAAAAAALAMVVLRSRQSPPGSSDGESAVQFTIVAPEASKVVVVGDFNGWDVDSRDFTARHAGGGVWTVTAQVPAGHHRYSFVLDDSVWVADPAAPRVEDSDFRMPSSALVVGEAP